MVFRCFGKLLFMMVQRHAKKSLCNAMIGAGSSLLDPPTQMGRLNVEKSPLATLEVVAVDVARARSSTLETVELVIVMGSDSKSSRARSSSL